MAAKKKVDPIKQREKRAKIAAIGGVVLLLAVAALAGPEDDEADEPEAGRAAALGGAPAGTSAFRARGAADATRPRPASSPTRTCRRRPSTAASWSRSTSSRRRIRSGRRSRAPTWRRGRRGLGATATQSAPGTASHAASSATTPPRSRSIADDDRARDRRAVDAGGAEHSGDHRRPPSPQRRPSRSPSTESTSHVAQRWRVPERHARLPARLLDEGHGPDRDRRRLLLDGRPDARADPRQAGHPAEHEQRPAVQARSCSPRLRGWRPRPKLPIDPAWAESPHHATNPASA